MKIDGSKVLVTGATGGIGAALSRGRCTSVARSLCSAGGGLTS